MALQLETDIIQMAGIVGDPWRYAGSSEFIAINAANKLEAIILEQHTKDPKSIDYPHKQLIDWVKLSAYNQCKYNLFKTFQVMSEVVQVLIHGARGNMNERDKWDLYNRICDYIDTEMIPEKQRRYDCNGMCKYDGSKHPMLTKDGWI